MGYSFQFPPTVSLHPRRILAEHSSHDVDEEDHICESPSSSHTPLAVDILLTRDRHQSQGSTSTDFSTADSLFSKFSAAESATTEPAETSTDALVWANRLKGEGPSALTHILLGPMPDLPCESKHRHYTAAAPR